MDKTAIWFQALKGVWAMGAASRAGRTAVLCVIGLITPTVVAEVIDSEGTVKAVDADAKTIIIERKTAKGTKTLDVEVAKKAGDLSSLKVGDEISFSYDPDLELVMKIDAVRQQAETFVAAGDDGFARPFLDKMLTAIEEDDYNGFVADTSPAYKATVTKEIVAKMNEVIGSRMKKGHEVSFLTELKQRGRKAYLWKWTFKDGGDDYSVRLWLKDGKVDGFLIQTQ